MNRIRLLLKKLVLNLWLDIRFLSNPYFDWPEKLRYYVQKYTAIVTNKRVIRYLGRDFEYDNRFMPTLLQNYASEIERLNDIVPLGDLESVLDIGANLGQFALTLKKRHSHLSIYSFEPNQAIFPLLKSNCEGVDGMFQFNCAVGPEPGMQEFYVVDGKSGQGSFYEENATLKMLNTNTTKTKVNTVRLDRATLEDLHIPSKVDLVKIDVEGFEFHVLEALESVEIRYLYLELSLNRAGKVSRESVLSLIEKMQGKPVSVLHESREGKKATFCELVLKVGTRDQG